MKDSSTQTAIQASCRCIPQLFLGHVRIILLSYCIFLSAIGQSQTTTYAGINFGYLDISGYDNRVYGGLDLQIKFSNGLGIAYSLYGGPQYFHMPAAPVGGVVLGLIIGGGDWDGDSSNFNIGLGVVLGLLTAAIPEGVFYELELSPHFSVAPYINPLQLDFIKNKGESENTWGFGGSAGIRLHALNKSAKFRISPYADYKIHYNEARGSGISFGGILSYKLE